MLSLIIINVLPFWKGDWKNKIKIFNQKQKLLSLYTHTRTRAALSQFQAAGALIF